MESWDLSHDQLIDTSLNGSFLDRAADSLNDGRQWCERDPSRDESLPDSDSLLNGPRMERKPPVGPPEKHLPLLTEGKGASLGYRGHGHEQAS
jgi:hypothetical protein